MKLHGSDKKKYCILVFRDSPGKCLHLDRGHTSNGTKIQLWDIIDESHPDFLNQVWIVDGPLIRSAKAPTQVIHKEHDWMGVGHRPGIFIHLWREVDAGHKDQANQEWMIKGNGAIVSKSHPKWGWNADWNKTSNGTRMLIHTHHHKFNARWLVAEDTPDADIARLHSSNVVPEKGRSVWID